MRTAAKSGFNIVQATTADEIAAARELFLAYAQSLSFNLCFQSFDRELAGLPGDYAPPRGRLLLAKSDQQSVATIQPSSSDGRAGENRVPIGNAVAFAGCVALHPLDDDVCEMKRLYVRPEWRGHSLGRRLVDAVIAEARAIGYRAMRLDTVPSAMATAVELYRQIGFREIAPYRMNPIEGAIYLELPL